MFITLLLLPLAAVFQGAPQEAIATQGPVDRKVRIEIVTTENGETKRITKEFDPANTAEFEDALREIGVIDHLNVNGDDENVTIDIRRYSSDMDSAFSLSMAALPPNCCEPKAYLGIRTEPLTDALRKEHKITVEEGAFVDLVADDKPAAKAGLKVGDVITSFDKKSITSPQELIDAIRSHEPGDEVELTYYRQGKKTSVKVQLAEQKADNFAYAFGPEHGGEEWDWESYFSDSAKVGKPRAFLGVTPGDGEGAVIGSVEEGTAAEKMGILPGDVITHVNDAPISDFDALSEAIKSNEPGSKVSIKLLREGKLMTMNGELGKRKVERMFHIDKNISNGPMGKQFEFHGMAPEDRATMRRELDELRREMTEMRREMRNGPRSETHITIETMPLNADERALLQNNGVDLGTDLKLNELSVFPNPSNGFFRIHFDVPDRGDLFVNVHDAKGEKVYEERITGFKGLYERTLDLSDKKTGTYFLVVQQGGKSTAQKLVKQ